jgi:pilus assembly protein CpaE
VTAIAAATASVDLEERLATALGGAVTMLPPGPLPTDLAHLRGQLGGSGTPSVVVLDCGLGQTEALALAGRLAGEPGGPRVVLVSEQGPELALAALRAGVFDILAPDVGVAELTAVLGQAAAAAAPTQVPLAPSDTRTPPRGRVISVVSSKGGVGKTTLSTNIAVGLAQHAPKSTVLVDLDVQFGDVASALSLTPEYTLADAVAGVASRDSMVLKTFLTLHPTGLYVLAAPESPAAADGISAAHVDRLLSMLAAEFAFVVVDTAPGLSEHTLAALDRTTDPVLLTSMDVRSTRRLVLNFADPRSGLTLADVEATIGTTVDVSVPRSRAVPTSVNLGVPLLQEGNNDKATRQLRGLVDDLLRGPDGAPGKPTVQPKRASRPAPVPRRAANRWFRPAARSAS